MANDLHIKLLKESLEECGFMNVDVDMEHKVIYCGHPFFCSDNMNIDDGEKLISFILYHFESMEMDDFYRLGMNKDGFYRIGII